MGFERTSISSGCMGDSGHSSKDTVRFSKKRGLEFFYLSLGVIVLIGIVLYVLIGKIFSDNPISRGISFGGDILNTVTDSLECRNRLINQNQTIIALEEKERMELEIRRQDKELQAKEEVIENYAQDLAEITMNINDLELSSDCTMGTPEEWSEWLDQYSH